MLARVLTIASDYGQFYIRPATPEPDPVREASEASLAVALQLCESMMRDSGGLEAAIAHPEALMAALARAANAIAMEPDEGDPQEALEDAGASRRFVGCDGRSFIDVLTPGQCTTPSRCVLRCMTQNPPMTT